ncbi:GH36-type glycosyl hydrolase domain-containing protein [Bartonella sp. DGB2]|uniref:GH36-type glycosyl hydrolase domain-containing protein n=1 Tax=Bartonella sp. DGB2 TaxID=3388426 RepID=UPI00398FE447
MRTQALDVHNLPPVERPLRARYKSDEELQALAQQLAQGVNVDLPEYQALGNFSKRLNENAKSILYVFRLSDAAARNNETITPAAQWLLDNHYTIDKAIQQVRRDLPKSFVKQLPLLSEQEDLPRIFALAWLYIAYTDSNFSTESLTHMVEGYQKVTSLQIGELWALPSVLRFLLIENARRLSLRIERARRMRRLANYFADQLALAKEPNHLSTVFAKAQIFVNDATFANHLFYRLRSASKNSTKALAWLEDQLAETGGTPESAALEEHGRQSAGGMTMGSVIQALRAIDDMEWTDWFETVSHVDACLQQGSDFSQLDLSSRNAYRRVIEQIARHSSFSEVKVAQEAIALARSAVSYNDIVPIEPDQKNGGALFTSTAQASIAWYLLGEGRGRLEQRCSYKMPFAQRIMRAYLSLGIYAIIWPVVCFTLLILSGVACFLQAAGVPYFSGACLLFLTLLPAWDAALGVFHSLVSWLVPPTRLIGYEYKNGIPPEARTMVVVPTLITSRDGVDEHMRNLEMHYLSNMHGAVHFALLTDWADAAYEENDDDRDLLRYAQNAIDALNTRYPREEAPLFFLLHRRRLYNAAEGCWMGWERKRGKLHELNLLLRGDQDTSYFPPDPRLPMDCRFVMTLDADTRLRLESVVRLVGKLNHPLNRPVFDKDKGWVVEGHGLLQPRITPSLSTGEETSLFQRIFSVSRGIDPYVFATSDTYQDLLGEGTFTGKGLYDIDVFEQAMAGRVVENSVLSHDLLEGGCMRAGLTTDVEIIEDYPASYAVDAARFHRWARGDWQLLPYLLNRKPVGASTRWRMLDNMRRSLNPLLWLMALLAGWLILPPFAALVWQIFLLVLAFIAPIFGLLRQFIPRACDVEWRGRVQALYTAFVAALLEGLLRLSFVAHSAYLMVDAIIRALYRMFVSHRLLLEWRTAAATKNAPNTPAYYMQLMWPACMIAVALVFLLLLMQRASLLWALPFALLWFLSPLIAWGVSQPLRNEEALSFDDQDGAVLRVVARRTWLYYETFVTEEHNHLPPDNFQEDPEPLVAARTSPTNIGMYLLSILAARDFGWVSFFAAVERVDNTLLTLEKMKKFRGHFYNWYDTKTLEPLLPMYVSTVDSGNLAGHLITLSSGLKEWAEAPAVFIQGDLNGLFDGLQILRETIEEIPDDRKALRPLRQRIGERLENFGRAVATLIAEPETATFRTINLSLVARDIFRLVAEFDKEIDTALSHRVCAWAERLIATCEAHNHDATQELDCEIWRSRLQDLSERARRLAFDMRFDFLENKKRRLLSIGYRVEADELDESCYDLLASEARLASFFAVAKGDVKATHWFRLGRLLILVGWKGALLSWSGSMFEYLMPPLIMREPLGSILGQTNRLIVRRQIEYARQISLPWGISEAAFNARDGALNYQYSNFGVPSLGLQRGLSRNAVIAPYASILAAQYMPHDAVVNLRRLQSLGALGEYGYHDAVDFTPSRVHEGEAYAVIRNYYAHHHGMSIVAINNVIFGGRMRARFHRDPVIEAAALLLQEKAPRQIPILHAKMANPMRSDAGGFENAPMQVIDKPLEASRATLLLSNGAYSTMLTAKGSGYSRWRRYALTRFSPDYSEDQQGSMFFLRDVKTERWWSATTEPTRVSGEATSTIFTDVKAEYVKTVDGIKSTLEVIVAGEADGEGRRIELVNTTDQDRVIEVISYTELALAPMEADLAHPAFSRLFIETEICDNGATLFAHRRKRMPEDLGLYMCHFVTDAAGAVREAKAETDRRMFIGRGRSIRRPAIFDVGNQFSHHEGCVMDPIFSICCRVRVPAHKKVNLIFWTFVAEHKETLEQQISHYRQPHMFQRAFSMAWTRNQVALYQNGIRPKDAMDYQKLATPLIYPDRSWRLAAEVLNQNLGCQSDLWPMAISGDYPIVLLRIDNEANLNVLSELLKAHEYWRLRGLVVDLVVLNERGLSYSQDTQRAIEWVCEGYGQHSAQMDDSPHIFTLRRDQLSIKSFQTLLASARVVLQAQSGSLGEQIRIMENISLDVPEKAKRVPKLSSETPKTRYQADSIPSAQGEPFEQFSTIGLKASTKTSHQRAQGDDLRFWNGYGGFSEEGYYIIRLRGRTATPHPWINVVANSQFGFHVSAEGASFSWSQNSRDYQLTPWANDPVSNRPGEALYIVDRQNFKRFSPVSAVECQDEALYEACHGFGFSRFQVDHDGLALELTHTLLGEEPVKLSRLTVRNHGKTARQLRLYNYLEWVLGVIRAKNAPFILSHYDEERGALFVRNPYHLERPFDVSFVASSLPPMSVSTDRAEFIGVTGTVRHPEAIRQAAPLSNRIEGGCDPCAALAYDFDLEPGETRDIIFYLGSATSQTAAEILLDKARAAVFDTVLEEQKEKWRGFFGGLQVKTPDPAFDIMVNQWLPYQAYACRILARAAFYQASGAYGFRDQLQDSLALCHLKPQLARDQLLNAAQRQFVEGDVQHWWLPQSGAGVRTLISDDVVWLGYAMALYVKSTNDVAVLDETLPFLMGEVLKPGQHDAYFVPEVSDEQASLYEHCARALDLAIARTGPHGLPLILGGDWNDGMNLVGVKGRGESVWLGWFLGLVLDEVIPFAKKRGDEIRAVAWQHHVACLAKALEEHGWDGSWYRRGYFDDGTPLGAHGQSECEIDTIAQSFAVLAQFALPERQEQAMEAMLTKLYDQEAGLLRLFWPPFDKIYKEPGYIKAYPPGVRENGGQYTHGAVWAILALAKMGKKEEAYELFCNINPIKHGANPDLYRVEPYVMAADIYSVAERRGQGGWTWYTGSAGWFYRAACEAILGLEILGDQLRLDPHLPQTWPGYEADLQVGEATYHISVTRGKSRALYMDGKKLPDPTASLFLAQGGQHEIILTLSEA